MRSIVYNQDCLEAMRQMSDKAFDLAIVDPPYGRGGDIFNFEINLKHKETRHIEKQWNDNKPPQVYFTELQRVSTNQVIWGGNYFTDCLPVSRGWIYWDKLYQGMHSFSDGELAWTSFDTTLKTFTFRGDLTKAIHPTQKPVALYKWLLTNYAKPGNTILDTHLGSGSSRIAAYDLGFDFTGYELDKDYFDAQEKRFANHIAQAKLFDDPVLETVEQSKFEF